MTNYHPCALDNRGGRTMPFGYIYVCAGKPPKQSEVPTIVGRVGFGSHKHDPDLLAVWPCRETPLGMKPADYQRCRLYLEKAYPELVGKVADHGQGEAAQ